MFRLPHRRSLTTLCAAILAAACGSLLPRSEVVTDSPWKSFKDAELAFDEIVPYITMAEDLKRLHLDPAENPNVTILSYSDILKRFVPSSAVAPETLDGGVLDCLRAQAGCNGYEVDHRVIHRRRHGNFFADMLNFNRETEVTGWRFNAVVLVVDGVVVYKLTGGQPAIHEHEESRNPLGPLQGAGEGLLRH